jgi:hypothetical protein
VPTAHRVSYDPRNLRAIRGKEFPAKNRMRSGPATPTASYVDSCSPFVTAGRRNDRSSPTALAPGGAMSAAFAKAGYRNAIFDLISPIVDLSINDRRFSDLNRTPATDAVGQQPSLRLALERAVRRFGGGGRNARATSAFTRFWSVPRRPALANHRLPLTLPQSSGELRKAHVSLNPLSARLSRTAIQKTPPLVKKLWRM